MTPEEIRKICLNELLYKEDFLKLHQENLVELINNIDFIRLMEKICKEVSPDVIFSTDKENPDYKMFKNKYLYNTFASENLYNRFPAYRRIYTAVKEQGKTGLSAVISIFYAVKYLTINSVPLNNSSSTTNTDNVESDLDFRKKWAAKYRCDDGHYVRSKSEQLVDNWLYYHNICHAYEVLVTDKRNNIEYISDFYLPHLNTYMEIWGIKTPEYLARKKRKTAAYKDNGLKLIEMTNAELEILDDFLRRTVL